MADPNLKVKFGLIGVTHPHARAHLRTLELLDEVSSIVAWDEGEAVVDILKREKRPKLETTRVTLEQILHLPDIPILFVLGQNNRNADMIIRAAGAGKHVITEKPGATNANDLSRAVRAIRHAGVSMAVCYPWRFHPIARDIRTYIQQGALGRVMSIEARMITSQVHFRDPSHWLFKKNIAGGGILSWLGCHWIDLMQYLVQDEIESVSAIVGTLNGAAIDVEDTAAVSMQFASGALATLHAGYLLSHSDNGFHGAPYDTYIGIRGLKGRLWWSPVEDPPVLRIESTAPGWADAPQREIRYTIPPSEAYAGTYGLDFIRQFIYSAIRKETAPSSGEDALRVLRVIEAAYESSAIGRLVRVKTD